MKIISADEFLNLIRARVTVSTQSAVALDLGISRPYINDVLAGRHEPGPKIVRALGYEKVTMYRRVK